LLSGTKELRVVQEEWAVKVEKANSELEELRRQMAEKESELAEYTKSLEEVESKISIVHKKYEIRLAELEKRMNEVKDRQQRNTENGDNIKQKREHIKTKYQDAVIMGNKIAENAKSIAAQLVVLEKMATRLQSELEDKNPECTEVSEEDTKLKGKLKHLRDQVDENNKKIDFLHRQADQAKRRIVENTASMMEIRSSLPALQDQKKYAVSARNFKEAGRVSNQIKQLQSEEAEKEASISADKESLRDFEQRFSETESMLKENLSLKNELERKLELETINMLKNKKVQLIEDIKHVKSLGSVEKGTFGETVVDLFSFEIDACDVAAMSIANKLNDESLAQIVLNVDNEKENTTEDDDEEDAADFDENDTTVEHDDMAKQEEKHEEGEDLNTDEVAQESEEEATDETTFDKNSSEAEAGSEELVTEYEVKDTKEELKNNVVSDQYKNSIEKIVKLEEDIRALADEIDAAVEEEEYELAADLEEEAAQMKEEITKLKESVGGEERFSELVVQVETEAIESIDKQVDDNDNDNIEGEDEDEDKDKDKDKDDYDYDYDDNEDSEDGDRNVDDVPHIEGSF